MNLWPLAAASRACQQLCRESDQAEQHPPRRWPRRSSALEPKTRCFSATRPIGAEWRSRTRSTHDIGGNEASFAGDDNVNGRNMVAAWTRSFHPALSATFGTGIRSSTCRCCRPRLTNPMWKTIPGRQTDDPFQPSAPIVGTTGYAGLGNARSTPLIRQSAYARAVAGISSLKSNHNLKFGVDLRFRTSGETASPPGESAFGRWVFDPTYTTNPASPGGTGETIATHAAGLTPCHPPRCVSWKDRHPADATSSTSTCATNGASRTS